MAIFTLPGPIYDYSVELVGFEADIIEFYVKEDATAATEDKPTYTATMNVKFKYIKGLSDVKLSITPSGADLGSSSTTPGLPGLSSAQVASSLVWKSAYIPRGTDLTLTLNFRPQCETSGVVTFLLMARELKFPASVSTTYPGT